MIPYVVSNYSDPDRLYSKPSLSSSLFLLSLHATTKPLLLSSSSSVSYDNDDDVVLPSLIDILFSPHISVVGALDQ